MKPHVRSLISISVGLLLYPAIGQAQVTSCLGGNEKIYAAGEDGVKDPKLRLERGSPEKPITVNSLTIFEVIINSSGKICEIHPLKAQDEETAKELTLDIRDNFRFAPATRKGKPVAVRFEVVFHPAGDQHLR